MDILEFCIKPVPKGRPRFGKGRTYTPKKTADFENAIKDMAKKQWKKPPLQGRIVCAMVFSFKKPKTGKLKYPSADGDNLVKALWDGLQGVVFENDRDIVGFQALKVYGEDKIVISIGKEGLDE